MKLILLSLLLLNSISSFAAENLGQQIEFSSIQGLPQFSVLFEGGSNGGLYITGTIPAAILTGGKTVSLISWRLWDDKTKTFVNAWKVLTQGNNIIVGPYFSFSLALDSANSIQALKNMKYLKLVLSVSATIEPPAATHVLEVGAYCQSQPGHFMNIDTDKEGCP